MSESLSGTLDAIAAAITNPPAPVERRFGVVVNFADPDGVGECMLIRRVSGFRMS